MSEILKTSMGKANKFRIPKREVKNREDATLCDGCDRYFVSSSLKKDEKSRNYCTGCEFMKFSSTKYNEPLKKTDLDRMLKVALRTPPLTFEDMIKDQKKQRTRKKSSKQSK